MHFTIVGGRYDRPPGWRQSRATPLGVALPQTPTPNSPRPNPPRAVSEGLRLKLRHRATPKMQEKVRCCVAVPALCSPLPSIGGTRFAQLLRRRIYRAANSAHATLRRRRPRPRPRPRRSVNLEESCDSGARRAPPRAQGGRGATASSSRCDTARWAAGALPAPSTALPDGQNKARGEGRAGGRMHSRSLGSPCSGLRNDSEKQMRVTARMETQRRLSATALFNPRRIDYSSSVGNARRCGAAAESRRAERPRGPRGGA